MLEDWIENLRLVLVEKREEGTGELVKLVKGKVKASNQAAEGQKLRKFGGVRCSLKCRGSG